MLGGETTLDKLREDHEVTNLHKKKHRITGTDIVTREGEKIGEVRDLLINERGF